MFSYNFLDNPGIVQKLFPERTVNSYMETL